MLTNDGAIEGTKRSRQRCSIEIDDLELRPKGTLH
jgi:hypothetical protein